MKAIEKIGTDSRVQSAWSEGEDGYWVMLKTGFADFGHDPHVPAHTIHEWTIRSVLSRLRDVRKCECSECKS